MFGDKKYSEVHLAGELKCSLTSWKTLTKDQEMLLKIEGYKIPFSALPQQIKLFPCNISMKPDQQGLIGKGKRYLFRLPRINDKGFRNNLFCREEI